MTVNDEVTIRRLLILANAGLNQWGVLHGGKSLLQILANSFQAFSTDHPFPERRIKRGSASVVGDLKASSLITGNSVAESIAMLGPDRQVPIIQARCTSRHAEEK